MANPENMREVYASIVGYLPEDAQRVINDYLPVLESLADEEAKAFGNTLADHLCERTEGVFHDGETEMQECLRGIAAKRTEVWRELEDRGEQTAGQVNDVRQLLDELVEVVEGDSAAARRVSVVYTLHPVISQLRIDCLQASGGEAFKDFISRFNRWKRKLRSLFRDSTDSQESEAMLAEISEVVAEIRKIGEREYSEGIMPASVVSLVDRLRTEVRSLEFVTLRLKERLGRKGGEGEEPQLRFFELSSAIEEMFPQLNELDEWLGIETNELWRDEDKADRLLSATASVSQTVQWIRDRLLPDAGRQTEEWIRDMRRDSLALSEDVEFAKGGRELITEEAMKAGQSIENIRTSYDTVRQFVDNWMYFGVWMQEGDRPLAEILDALERMADLLDKIEEAGAVWSSRLRVQQEVEPQLGRLEDQVRAFSAKLNAGAARSIARNAREIVGSARTKLDDLAAIEGTIEFLKISNRSLVDDCQRCINSNKAFLGRLQQSVKDGVAAAELRH